VFVTKKRAINVTLPQNLYLKNIVYDLARTVFQFMLETSDVNLGVIEIAAIKCLLTRWVINPMDENFSRS
jgi:hypothetical protein